VKQIINHLERVKKRLQTKASRKGRKKNWKSEIAPKIILYKNETMTFSPIIIHVGLSFSASGV